MMMMIVILIHCCDDDDEEKMNTLRAAADALLCPSLGRRTSPTPVFFPTPKHLPASANSTHFLKTKRKKKKNIIHHLLFTWMIIGDA